MMYESNFLGIILVTETLRLHSGLSVCNGWLNIFFMVALPFL